MKTHRRSGVSREVRRSLSCQSVEAAVGEISHGCEIYGLTGGQFSLVDLIVYCLRVTGPAEVVISTWTAAGADINFAFKLLTDGSIRSLRFIVDFSFPSRQPTYCAALRERFGDDAIRITKNHCKFVLIRNDGWDLVVRTSMNLNENSRLENFEISDDKSLADYLAEVVEQLFAAETGPHAFAKRPFGHVKAFETFIGGDANDTTAMLRSTDAKKYFGDGPLDNDLRRAGLIYEKGAVL